MCGLMVSVSESHDTPDQQCDLHRLGNDKDNSMPYCQLNRLMNYLELQEEDEDEEILSLTKLWFSVSKWFLEVSRKFRRKVGLLGPRREGFWIDTMCIPLNDEELRRNAIKRMIPTYVGAWRGLLLDSRLLNTPSNIMEREVRATLIRSAWMGRIWTMQESYLVQHLSVRLSDRVIRIIKKPDYGELSVSEGVSRELFMATNLPSVGNVEDRGFNLPMRENRLIVIWKYVLDRLTKKGAEYRGVKVSLREVQLIEIWNDLLGRSMKKAGDGAIVFASLLDFYAQDVLPLSLNERIKAIFTAQDALPLEFLFSGTSRLLSNSHLDRWIPKLPGDCWLNLYTKLGSAEVISGQGMKIDISGSDATTVTFWLPPQSRRFTNFRLRGVIEGTEIGVSLHNLNSIPQLCSPDQPRLLMLERDVLSNPDFSHGVHIGSGAILCQPQFEETFATAVFDSAVTFRKLSRFEPDAMFMNSPVIDGEVKTLQSIWIRSGNFSPLQLTFRMKMTDAVPFRYSGEVQEISPKRTQCSCPFRYRKSYRVLYT